jgi:hypothetical protein
MSLDTSTEARLEGELASAPSPAWATVLSAVTGVALVRGSCRAIGRLALAYRRPAVMKLSARGLEVSSRTELLGRVLAEREALVPLSNIASVTRELRFARVGLYAGLLSLVLGTYLGVGLLADGARVPGGSPSLIGMGLAAIALGIVLDYAFAVVVDVVRETCQVVVRPHHGPALCIRGLDAAEADRVLSEVARATLGEAGPDEMPLSTPAAESEPSPAPAGVTAAEPKA